MKNELCHHGVLGMKWGIRRYQNKDGTLTSEGKRRLKNNNRLPQYNKKVNEKTRNRTIRDLSDDEIKQRIYRLELEKKYKDLLSSSERNKNKKIKDFVMDILEKSGKNIATQATTYALGTMVNKMAGTNVVNPKKGQKDK